VPACEKIPACQLYYDVRDGSYLAPLNGRYVTMKLNDIRMRFRALGLSDEKHIITKEQGLIRETDWPLLAAQNHRMIDFAGAIAGRRVGTHRDSVGRLFLVTEEASGVWEPVIKDAAPKFFPSFVTELLPGDQADIFCFWLAHGLRAMREGSFAPGQAAFLAGEPKCGKSLLQLMVTEILGGRAANPFEYLMGEKFNKDLAVAEHWMVEDPGTSTDIRTRRLFGEKIKEATVNRDIRVNGKGKDAGLIQTFRRVTISINKEQEALAVCPPMVEGVKDKIMLFMCDRAAASLDTFRDKNGTVDRAALWTAFMGELHAIRSWLLKKYRTIPRAMGDDRMGIRYFHHPEFLAALSEMTYESRFLELIDELYFGDEPDNVPAPQEKKASAFLKELLEHNRFEVEKVVRSPGQSGAHFAKLAKSHPQRISSRVLNGHTLWTVKPPLKIEDKTND
jgi:hypothetical protein